MKIAQVGEHILQTPAQPVTEEDFGSQDLLSFVNDLKQTMMDANGVGIAAPQVFDPRAIMVIASRPNDRYPDAPDMTPTVMINPEVTSSSDEKVWGWEGCLSVPGLRGNILRSEAIEVTYRDERGNVCEMEMAGFVARIFQHEQDHLLGKTWLDRVTDTQHIMAEAVWREKILGQA